MGLKKAESRVPDQEAFLLPVRDRGELDGFLAGLARCSEQSIFALDAGGRIVDCSLAGELLLGLTRQELTGTSILDHCSEPDSFQSLLNRLQDHPVLKRDVTFVHSSGRAVPCRVSLSLWLDQEGGCLGSVAVATDNSAWLKFQDDLVHIDRLAEMGRMLAAIVHDLKNPLSVISQASGWGSVVIHDAKGMGEEDRSELRNTFAEIEEQTNRCRMITNQILDFARGAGPQKVSIDLRQLIDETLRYMKPELKYPPVEILTGFPEQDVVLQSNAQLLQQVLVNLISNAIYAVREKHIEDGGQIRITVEQSGDGVQLSVSDNGPGIEKDKLDNIFELFYTTKPVGRGTGLGLPICRKIVHSLGGTLRVESRPGEGTTFTIALSGDKT
jgi:PAS domain S-box-containing protein